MRKKKKKSVYITWMKIKGNKQLAKLNQFRMKNERVLYVQRNYGNELHNK